MQRDASDQGPALGSKNFLRSLRPDDGAAKPRSLNRAAQKSLKKRPLAYHLAATTCLSTFVLLPAAARAQNIPADITPQGGSVAAGSAAIIQAPGSTIINQSSARTVINWQSFNVGSAASVQFNQPSASAIALNRVVSPSPSIIAGQINANGQLVLINQSGVVVTKGADINAESVVLATSNIADKDFMAGNMVFSGAPNAGAKIVNNGNITVRDTGLVGLVAPQVENNGVITARLGQVTLAGASAFTLDLYGDRLISLDVTKAVRAVDVGGILVHALVTNRGLILADGGKITLTAQDADALVTQLIDAGGTIRADSVGPQAGTIAISGVGGDITIAGNLLARGTAAGTTGGSVQALTTGTISVAPGALIDASGAAGGGIIALGTDLRRAREGAADVAAPRADAVAVAAGAQLAANATQSGNAGRVVLLAEASTDFEGLIAVQAGPAGGNGGVAEISSGGVISLGGTVLDAAPKGQAGQVLLDPATLVVNGGITSNAASFSGAGGTTLGDDGASGTSTISAASLASLSGTIILEASSLISVGAALGLTSASALTLASLGDITINAGISLSSGSLDLDAGNTLFVGGPLAATDISLRGAGPGGITLAAPVDATGSLLLQSGGDIVEAPGGYVSAAALSGTAAGDAGLGSSLNNVLDLNGFSASRFSLQDGASTTILSALGAGSITLVTPNALDIGAPIAASTGDVELVANALAFGGTGTVTAPADGAVAYAPYTPAGIELTGANNALAYFSAGTIVLGSADGFEATALIVSGDQSLAGNLQLVASGVVEQSGTLTAGNLAISGSSIELDGLVTSAGVLDLTAPGEIVDAGVLTAATLAFSGAAFGEVTLSGPITAGLLTGSAASGVVLGNLDNQIAALGAITIGNGNFFMGDGAALAITAPLQARNVSILDTAAGGLALGAAGSLLGTGTIDLTADALSAAAGAAISATAVTLAPYSDAAIDLGGTSAGALGLGQSVFTAAASVPVLQIGTGGGNILTNGAVAASPGTLLLDAGAITFASAFETSGVLTLEVPGNVAETAAGLVTAATLTGAGTLGNVGLAAADNSIGTLGAIQLASGGTLALADGGLLTAAGPVTAAFVTLSAATLSLPGNISAGAQLTLDAGNSIAISGDILAGSVLLALTGGQVTEGAGAVVSTPSLSGSGGNGSLVELGNGANSIASLGGMTVSFLDLADSEPLDVTGALAAGNAMLAAPGIAFNAAADVRGVLALISTAGISESAAITAGTLTSGGATDQGGADLDENPNSIGTLGAFSLASGNFALEDVAALTLTGPLNAPSANLSAPGLAINGAISTTSQLTIDTSAGIAIAAPVNAGSLAVLNAGGAVTETAGGTLSALMLTDGGGSIGSLDLGQANAIATLSGAAVTGAITLNDTAPLTLAGASTAAGASLTAASLDFTGTFISTQPLQLATTAGVTESAGAVISAPSLAGGNTGGNVALTSSGNSISSLGGFAFGAGTFALNDAKNLTVAGALAGGSAALSAPSIALTGAILTSSAATLAASGNISETGGTVNTGSLSLDAGNVTLGGNTNIVAAVSGTGDNVTLADQAALSVGNLSAADLSLTAPSINFTGDVSAGLLLSLDSPGAMTQTGGAIDAGTLASAGTDGATSLNQQGNAVFTLGGFSASSFGLVDSLALNVTGPLAANSAALSAAGIALNGPVTVPGVLTLGGSGGVTQSAALSAGTLAGALGGDADLNDSANSVATLGDFANSGTLTLMDAAPLSVAGAVSAAAANLRADGISLTGSLLTAGATQLASTAGISESTTATLAAASLGGTDSGGDVALPGANSIASLGDFSFGSGSFALSDTVPLNVTGALTGGTASLTAPSIVLSGNINAADALTLASSAGGAEQTSGGITTPNLILDSGGNSALAGNANTIASLSGNAGAVTLTDQAALAVSNLTASNIALTAPAISLGGGIDASGRLALDSPGGITQSAPITAGTLGSDGATDGTSAFTQSGNAIGTLGGFSASSLNLVDSAPLTLAGPISATVIQLSAPAMVFAGNLTAGTLALASTGGISQSGGGITAGTLTTGPGGITGSTVLGGANAVSTLASVTDFDGFTLASDTPLTTAGSIAAADVALSADGIAITGPIDTGILQLSGGGNVAESGAGVILAGELTTGAAGLAGGAALDNPANEIAMLGAFDATGGLALDDGQALNLSGLIQLGGTLDFADPDSVTQTGGTLAAAGLATSGSGIGGGLSLAEPGNAISSIGNLTLGGSALIENNVALDLTGTLAIGGGDLTLVDTGPISQTSGMISTGLLSASASNLALPDANSIGSFGSIFVAGDAFINGAQNLTGLLSAGSATFTSPGSFSLAVQNGNVGGNLLITAAGDVTQTSGSLTTGNLTISATNIALNGDNRAGGEIDLLGLGNVTQSGVLYASNIGLLATGNVTQTGALNAANATISGANITLGGDDTVPGRLDLLGTGSVTQTGGVLSAGTLSGTGNALASFGGTGATAEIGTLGRFILADSLFELNDGEALTITGPVIASTVLITATGQLVLDGSAGGGLYITGGLAAANAALPPSATQSELAVLPNAAGASLITGTGTFTINNGAPATIFLVTASNADPGGGGISFGNDSGLQAPSADVILAAGTQGSVTGNVNAAQLEILSANSVNLTGLIDGIAGGSAAALATSAPGPSPQYQFNACEIAVVNCGISALQIVQESATATTTTNPVNKLFTPMLTANPLENFDISQRKRRRLNKNVQLPGIATHDF